MPYSKTPAANSRCPALPADRPQIHRVSRYAAFVQGTRTIDDFTDGVRRAGNHTETPDYADRSSKTLPSLRKFEATIETKP